MFFRIVHNNRLHSDNFSTALRLQSFAEARALAAQTAAGYERRYLP